MLQQNQFKKPLRLQKSQMLFLPIASILILMSFLRLSRCYTTDWDTKCIISQVQTSLWYNSLILCINIHFKTISPILQHKHWKEAKFQRFLRNVTAPAATTTVIHFSFLQANHTTRMKGKETMSRIPDKFYKGALRMEHSPKEFMPSFTNTQLYTWHGNPTSI